MLTLGIDSFTFEDLYTPQGLKRLHDTFFDHVLRDDPALHAAFGAYRANPTGVKPTQQSDLLIRLAEHVSRFVARLFQVDAEKKALASKISQELELFEFKREFVTR